MLNFDPTPECPDGCPDCALRPAPTQLGQWAICGLSGNWSTTQTVPDNPPHDLAWVYKDNPPESMRAQAGLSASPPDGDVELVNHRDLTAKVAAQVPDLLVMIADLNARLDIPKADLGNTELRRTIRDVRQLARDMIQLARLVGNVLDSTDSGTP